MKSLQQRRTATTVVQIMNLKRNKKCQVWKSLCYSVHSSFLNLALGDIARLPGLSKPSEYVCCMMALVVLLDFVINACVYV